MTKGVFIVGIGNFKEKVTARCPKNKTFILIMAAIIAVIVIILIMNFAKGDETLEFRVLSDSEVPQDITSQVIPQYRDLERALACIVDDKVYVLVTRGEKPTSGYEICIESMTIEEDDGRCNLVVFAGFKDPEPGGALTQVLTYPLQVAETELEKLPDSIELRVKY